MMKTLTMILAFLVALGMLTGCSEEVETPTNVNSPVIQQQVKGEETSGLSESVQQDQEEQSESVKEQPVENKQEEKTASKEEKKEVVVSEVKETNKEAGSNDNIEHGDEPAYIPPSFTSMEGFRSWMQNGGMEEEKRANLLNSVKNSTTFSTTSYCRPKLGDGNDEFVLTEIEAYPYSVIYRYGFAKNKNVRGLQITTYVDPVYMKNIEEAMQETYDEIEQPDIRVFDQYGSHQVKGITYYYYHFPKNNGTLVYWQIEGNTFYAVYYGDYDQINNILPLLELEQVEYKIADNGSAVK